MNLAVDENASFEEQRGKFMAASRLEYLQDEDGVYGVSIPFLTYDGPNILTYILRPDRLGRGSGLAALQTPPRGIFRSSDFIESRLVEILAEAIHARGGFAAGHRPNGRGSLQAGRPM